MKDFDYNPLKEIFSISKKGEITEEIESIKNIPKFFSHLKNESISERSKIKLIEDFISKLEINRYISEYFSKDGKKSIYLSLFDLYLDNNSSGNFKEAIILLLNELRINIQIGKDIFEYIFQKLSQLYRGEQPITAEIMNNYLKLLYTILGETEGCLPPKNYFACSGSCKFFVDLNKKIIEIANGFTIITNFKISVNNHLEMDPAKARISNLIKIYFSSKKTLSVDLQYPFFLVVKEIRKEFIKQFPIDEWVNLIMTITYTDKLQLFFYVNGENHLTPFNLKNLNISKEDSITYIEFFNDFYGEVSSIYMFSQKEAGPSNLNSTSFLSEFKNYKEGLWKKKRIETFFDFTSKIDAIQHKEGMSGGIDLFRVKTLGGKLGLRSSMKAEEKKKNSLYDCISFLFTPIHYRDNRPNFVDDAFCKYQLQFSGNIKNHRFLNFQKHLILVCELNNFFPIAEMFVLYPDILTEANFQIFLKIIGNIFNFRKHNIKCVKQFKFFKVLRLFIEKFPNQVFTEGILNAFYSLGKTLFINNLEDICSNYFKHILLNEKILSKYNENLQIQFWNKLYLFCQSDCSQIETFINMNRLCLILRFYDRNKYTEMCCSEHLKMFKDDFAIGQKIMKPSMPKKLSYLKNIMGLIIESQEAMNSIDLFKLLTLDLSPCLTKFILNVFIDVFEKVSETSWKDTFVEQLLLCQYEVIIINTYVHALPDVKLDILKFIYLIHQRLVVAKRANSFKTFEKMIKTCLLPQKMFYVKPPSMNLNNINKRLSVMLPISNLSELYGKKEPPKKQEQIKQNIFPPIKKPDENVTTHTHGRKSQDLSSLLEKYDNENNQIKGEENAPIKEISKPVSIAVVFEKKKTLPNPNIDYLKNINDEENIIANVIYNKKDNQIIVIKDEIIKDYVEKLFGSFFLWALSINIDYPLDAINLSSSMIKNSNTLEIIFLLNYQLNNIQFTNNYFFSIDKLCDSNENCYVLFFNKKLLSSFLDVTFANFKRKSKNSEKCYSLGKNILTKLYINSLFYFEKNQSMCPSSEIETIFIWGNKITSEDEDENTHKRLFEFIFDLLFEYLTQFKVKFENKMKFDIKDQNCDPKKNFYLKNYLILITEIFLFIFEFKLDYKLKKNLISSLYSSSVKIELPDVLVNSMRINNSSDDKISQSWLDFQLIYDIFHRVQFIWGKTNMYKKIILDKFKKNKPGKYDYIIENIILDKEGKNLYQRELEFLCFEEIKGNQEIMKPLIKVIPITFMCILSKLKNGREINDFKYWLKDFKHLIIFLIIASSNLTKINQEELYKNIQDKCLEAISSSLIFLVDLVSTSKLCKNKITSSIYSIFLFCFKLVKYQYIYINKHNKLFKLASKAARNDLAGCAIFILFTEYIKNKNGEPLCTLNYLESLVLDKNQQSTAALTLLRKNEWKDAFFENQSLKAKLNNNYFSLQAYSSLVDYRYALIPFLADEFDDSYKKKILDLLPQYEKELVKYSNNSLEKNLKIKNTYKKFKKHAFSWRGYWCSYPMFFENISQFKIKMVNHYTKTFMKPLLVPILDISYYLPEFSGFNPETLFREEKEIKNSYIISMDIDKSLKNSEQTPLENIKDSINDREIKYNYLRSIYSKSSKELDEILLRISNNLEFGKEEEFAFVERQSSNKAKKSTQKEKKYYLCCMVKTSHHIKGVCFVDNDKKKLNFKVFLNQKTGNAMNDVEIGFTTNDDDYDQERHTCFGSYFVCRPRDKDLYKISIKYNDIKWIFKRRYYYNNSAFEIYTYKNKTYYFNFKYENERDIILNEIVSKMDLSPIIDDLKETKDKDSFNVEVGYENKLISTDIKDDAKENKEKKKKLKLSKKIKKWKQWKITNFELLMWLNIFGNRSYNDLSQYPVFPWTLSNYEDPLQNEHKARLKSSSTSGINANLPYDENNNILATGSFSVSSLLSLNNNTNEEGEDTLTMDYDYRDLRLPMGMLELNEEGIHRKEMFIETYETLKAEPDENMKPYVFGSNYSNPIYVCNFLMRLFPFTHISIELQGHKFDDPNRLFISVNNSFYTSTSQKTDLRELIPEFFYLPEMFININNLNMGELETGEPVNDVKTPCHDNPYDFITTMKTVLENNTLSSNLQNWIDLIFGYKSKGKDAEIAHNIFTEASYQESVEINKVENKESFLRMVEFGLIPTQIMSKECQRRDKKEEIRKGREITDPLSDLKIYKCKYKNESENYNLNNIIVLKFVSFSPEKVTMMLNNSYIVERKICYSSFDKEYYDEQPLLIQIGKYHNRMPEIYSPKESNSKAVQFCHRGKTLIMGGFYDGKILIKSLDGKFKSFQIVPFGDKSPIISICVDKGEQFVFVGNMYGNIRILRMDPDPSKWKFLNIISDHLSSISYIDCNSDLNLWISASVDGYVNLYTLPSSKLIRVIKVPVSKCSYVFLSASPLPSIIVLGENDNKYEIFAYSINGFLIKRQLVENKISCPIVIKDLNSCEFLAYIVNDMIIIRSLPNLFIQTSIEDIPDAYAIYPSEDMKILYATNKNGGQVYTIQNELKKFNVFNPLVGIKKKAGV